MFYDSISQYEAYKILMVKGLHEVFSICVNMYLICDVSVVQLYTVPTTVEHR